MQPPTATSYELEALTASAPLDPTSPEHILQTAHREADRIREQAREEGFRKGRAEGLEVGEGDVANASAAFAAAQADLVSHRQAQAQMLEHEAVQLALALAEKILAGALAIEPERVLDVVRGALRIVEERRSITIFVNPEDVPIVESSLASLRSSTGGIEFCEVQADRRIARGGASVRTAEAEIDSSLETQLERVREIAEAELRNAGSSAAAAEAAA